MNDLRVPSTRETAARTYVALDTLGYLASESGDGVKASEYRVAAKTLLQAQTEKYDSTCKDYNCDEHFFTLCRNTVYQNDNFKGEIANRYLTPARRSFLVAKYNKPCHTMPCMRITYLDRPASTPFEPKNRFHKEWCSDTPASKASPVSEVRKDMSRTFEDPSLAQGQAAGTDMTVFGLTLGERLRLRNCPTDYVDKTLRAAARTVRATESPTCRVVPDPRARPDPRDRMDVAWSALYTSLTGDLLQKIEGEEEFKINLGDGKCPDFVTSCGVIAGAKKDVLEQVRVDFVSHEEKVVEQLRQKYNQPPQSRQTKRCQNEYGAQGSTMEHQWAVPGLHATLVLDGCNPQMFHNRLVVETESHYATRVAAARDAEGKKPKL